MMNTEQSSDQNYGNQASFSSSPVNIPVETVLVYNDNGYFGHCESLDSPRSSFDAELFDSMAATKFLKEYVNFNNEPSHTGTRTSKRQKEKVASFHKAQNSLSHQKRQFLNRQRRNHEQHIDNNYYSDSDSDQEWHSKKEIHKRKRSDHRNRALDRHFKEISLNTDVIDGGFSPPSESTNYCSLNEKVVDVPDQFKSLNSKCVIGSPVRKSAFDYGSDLEISIPFSNINPYESVSSVCTDSNRAEFYHTFSILLKAGTKDKSEMLMRQQSKEELIWQTSLIDLIWLELQAWHNGKSLKEQDSILCEVRGNISEVLNAVIDYKYDSCIETLCCQPPPLISCFDMKETFSGCSAFCHRYVEHVNQAYEQIYKLTEDVYNAEQLYPSRKALSESHALYNDTKFNAKYKTLCLWVNLISDLRTKLDILFNLFGIKNKWYSKFHQQDASDMDNEKLSRLRNDSGIFTSNGTIPSPSIFQPSDLDLSFVSEVDSEINQDNEFHENTHSVYHKYVEKKLRQKGGLRKTMFQLQDLLAPTVLRVTLALQPSVPASTYASVVAKPLSEDDPDKVMSEYRQSLATNSDMELHISIDPNIREELKMYGSNSSCYKDMSLPSFLPMYLYLIRISVDIMQECVLIRLEQQPKNPSLLSIQQLVLEIQEVIRAGIIIRNMFVELMTILYRLNMKPEISKIDAQATATELIDSELETFNDNLCKILQVYLSYIQRQMQLTQCLTDPSTYKFTLESDWSFMKHYSGLVRGGKILAAAQFCFFTRDLLENISDCLERSIDDANTKLYDILDTETDMASYRQNILSALREYKQLFHFIREKSQRVMSFAKMLRKDLEIAAEYQLNDRSCESWGNLFKILQHTNHVRVVAPQCKQYIMFVPGVIQKNLKLLRQLMDTISGYSIKYLQDPHDINNSGGYLLLMRYDEICESLSSWTGHTIDLEMNAENIINLSHIEVEGLLVIVTHSSQLSHQCIAFKSLVGNAVTLTKQHTSCNQAISIALHEVKVQALEVRIKVASTIEEVQTRFQFPGLTCMDRNEFNYIKYLCKEILIHGAYNFGFEYHRDIAWLVTCNTQELPNGLFSFAQMWMDFVKSWVVQGRGFKPKWAVQGLDFLSLISSPRFTASLSDDEFQNLKIQINNTVLHVIGSQNSSPSVTSSSSSPSLRSFSRFSGLDFDKPLIHSTSYQDTSVLVNRTTSVLSSQSEPDYSDRKMNFEKTPVGRVRKAISMIDDNREKNLMKHNKIGRVCDNSSRTMKFVARKVTFSWQRGKKIGEGRFGKVYTAVNNNTGELIAMKEIAIPLGDHKAIKEVTDEIYIFERLHHKHLVRYYGIEVHREEMYIFMELCNEGTLEYACQLGLVESTIRKYTQQLLQAINALHEQKIVHRDIKSANIFLTTDGNLKLGDFGCCIKLKSYATVPGELCAFVGTPAYMAPEVITQSGNRGHGRAADIWSLGCVVIEMFSGKRPWQDLENSQQIMFKVGMGGTPEVPEHAGDEGFDFISQCLVHEPSNRATAADLMSHSFTKYVLTCDE